MRAAAKRRRPNAMDDELRIGLVGHVDARQTAVAPGAIGDVVGDYRVVEAVAAAFKRPIGLLARREIHARQPIAADDLRLGRVLHVDGDENVVGKAIDHRRRIGPASADIPDAMKARALDRHEADLARRRGLGNVEHRHSRRPVARAVGDMRAMRAGLRLIVVALVRHLRLREHVAAMDEQQQIVVDLQMQAPGVGRILHIGDGLGLAWDRARRSPKSPSSRRGRYRRSRSAP